MERAQWHRIASSPEESTDEEEEKIKLNFPTQYKKILEERKMIQMKMDEEMIEEDDLVKELMAKMEDPEMRVEAIRVLKMVSETERKRNEKRMQRDEEEKTKRFGPR